MYLGEERDQGAGVSALRPYLSASMTLEALSREERQKVISYHSAGSFGNQHVCFGGDSRGGASFALNLFWE